MQTEIILRTDQGLVLIAPKSNGTFDLVGPAPAIARLQEDLNVLDETENPIENLGDCMARLAYLAAKNPDQTAAQPAECRALRTARRRLSEIVEHSGDPETIQTATLVLADLDVVELNLGGSF